MGPGQMPQFRPDFMWNDMMQRRLLYAMADKSDFYKGVQRRLLSPFLGPFWELALEQQQHGQRSAFEAGHEFHWRVSQSGRHWWSGEYDPRFWWTHPDAQPRGGAAPGPDLSMN